MFANINKYIIITPSIFVNIAWSFFVFLIISFSLLKADAFNDSILNHNNISNIDSLTTSSNNDLIKYNYSDYEYREFSNSKINEFYKSKDFSYFALRRQPIDLESIFWDLIARYFISPLQNLIGLSGAPYVMLAMLLILLGAISYLVFRKKQNSIVEKNIYSNFVRHNNFLENVFSIDYDKEIPKAFENNDFSQVVRLRYLKMLKLLIENKFLKFHISKTNSDYLNELSNKEFFVKFSKLSEIFDFVTYGEFVVNLNDYQQIDLYFNDFEEELNLYEKS